MQLVFCESASNNPDGTYSIVRGGLDRFAIEVPGKVNVVMFVEATADEVPAGEQHAFVVTVTGCGCGESTLAGHAVAPTGADVARFIMPITFDVKEHGTLHVEWTMGGAKASADIQVTPAVHA